MFKFRVIILAVFNAIIMIALCWFLMAIPMRYSDEVALIKWSSLIKKSLLHIDPKPSTQDLLFIDVSRNRMIVPHRYPEKDTNQYDIDCIVSRPALIDLLKIFGESRSKPRLVFLDVLLQDSTGADSVLQDCIDHLKPEFLAVSKYEGSEDQEVSQGHKWSEHHGKIIDPILNVDHAPANYALINGEFIKYPLFIQDSIETAPLALYEHLQRDPYTKKAGLLLFGGGVSFPQPIVDFKIRQQDLQDLRYGLGNRGRYIVFSIGEFIENYTLMDPTTQERFLKGKMVFIADFKNDLHETAFGKMPGVLLVLNSYLTLAGKQNLVPLAWIAFLLLSFFLLSLGVVEHWGERLEQGLIDNFKVKQNRKKLIKQVISYVSIAVMLSVITILSYILFDIHIQVLLLTLYLKVAAFIADRLHISPKIEIEE